MRSTHLQKRSHLLDHFVIESVQRFWSIQRERPHSEVTGCLYHGLRELEVRLHLFRSQCLTFAPTLELDAAEAEVEAARLCAAALEDVETCPDSMAVRARAEELLEAMRSNVR